jgi:hypothetical protein
MSVVRWRASPQRARPRKWLTCELGLNLAWDESHTVPLNCMKSFWDKWLTPPVWCHEVFFENWQARHPYDLDKLTQRDFIRVEQRSAYTWHFHRLRVPVYSRYKISWPHGWFKHEWLNKLFCAVLKAHHTTGSNPAWKRFVLLCIIQPCYA